MPAVIRGSLNYREIFLLLVIGKVLTELEADRVFGLFGEHNLIANEQDGFIPDRSCSDHIFTLGDLVRIRKPLNLKTLCAFVGLEIDMMS